jgi:sigma-E factor negative regulatory protein RseB
VNVLAEGARRRIGQVGMGFALLCAPAFLMAQGLPQARVEPAQWLGRIQSAANLRSYQGTLMFSAGGVVSSTRVAHWCDGRQQYERQELLDGRARLQYRHNDQVVTLWPDSRLAVVEQREAVAEFPALPDAPGLQPLDSYELRSMGSDRIAGHEVEVLMLKPRDALRFAQRLWADRDSGLLLRGDVLGPRGEVLESSAFTDLRVGTRLTPEAVTGPMRRLEGYRVVRPQAVKTELETEGWSLARSVPGFQLVGCSKRPLDAGAAESSSVQVLQSVFSDGLTHVSVFIEPFDAQRHKQPMRTSLGATHTLMSRHGDWWFTVVGEVPMATVQQFETLFERRR